MAWSTSFQIGPPFHALSILNVHYFSFILLKQGITPFFEKLAYNFRRNMEINAKDTYESQVAIYLSVMASFKACRKGEAKSGVLNMGVNR